MKRYYLIYKIFFKIVEFKQLLELVIGFYRLLLILSLRIGLVNLVNYSYQTKFRMGFLIHPPQPLKKVLYDVQRREFGKPLAYAIL